MASDNVNRSKARSAGVMMRVTVEERDELHAIAKSHGLSLQAYLEMVAFNRPEARERKPGRPRTDPELFDMTG